jgi:hypothetical protein
MDNKYAKDRITVLAMDPLATVRLAFFNWLLLWHALRISHMKFSTVCVR